MDLHRNSRLADSPRPIGGFEVAAPYDELDSPMPFVKRKPGNKADRQPSIATEASRPFKDNRKELGHASLDSPFAGSVAESGCRL
jgi:hypothetical protein